MKIQGLISGLVLMGAIMLLANEKKANLTGRIQDNSGFGIMSGSLEVYTKDAEHKLVYTTATEENGTFILSHLEPGEYEFIVKAQGFEDKIQVLKVEANSSDLGIITLDENFISLEEAVIYGKSSSKNDFVLLDTAVIYGKSNSK